MDGLYSLSDTHFRVRSVGKKKSYPKESLPLKPLVWLRGEMKMPPFTAEGRQETGMLLRLLHEGEKLGMPQAEPFPSVGPRGAALGIRDA